MATMAEYQEQERRENEESLNEYFRQLEEVYEKRKKEIIPLIREKMVDGIVSKFHIHKGDKSKVEKFVKELPMEELVSRNYLMREYYKPEDYEKEFKYELNKATYFAKFHWAKSKQSRSILGDVELTTFKSNLASGLKRKSKKSRKLRKPRKSRKTRKSRKSRKSRKHLFKKYRKKTR